MTTAEFLIFITFGPVVWVLAGMLGRKWQRAHWNLHLPYEERVRLLRGRD